jgi:hypothetical protein
MGEARRRKEFLKTHKLSIEQAQNVRNEQERELKDGTFKKDVLEQMHADGAQVTTAPIKDRVAYLMNALKAMDTVSGTIENCFLKITGNVRSSLTRREIGMFLKKILAARIEGYTYEAIGKWTHMQPVVIHQLDELAKLALKEEIEEKGFKDSPVLAGAPN